MSETLLSNTVYGLVGWMPQPSLSIKVVRQFIKICPCRLGSKMDKIHIGIFKAESKEKIQMKLGRFFARIPGLYRGERSLYRIIGEGNDKVVSLEEIVLNDELIDTILAEAMAVVDENSSKFNRFYVEGLAVYERIVNIIMDDMRVNNGVVWPDPKVNKGNFDEALKLNIAVIEKLCSKY